MCDCCSDCNCDRCLAVVPVTQETNNITLSGAALTLPIAQVDAQNVDVTFTASAAGVYKIDWWLADSAVPTTDKSQVLPTNPHANIGEVVTAADGTKVLRITNTGASRTWYLQAQLGAGIIVTAAITIGV